MEDLLRGEFAKFISALLPPTAYALWLQVVTTRSGAAESDGDPANQRAVGSGLRDSQSQASPFLSKMAS